MSDPSSFNHFRAHVNGINMHYVMSGKGVPLVLCHGWPDLWFGWRKQIPALTNAGYQVIVPSLRGFGQTDAPLSPSSYGLNTITTDLAKLLDYLKIDKAVFIGHDHGGALVWRMCLYYPSRVIAVASFCTPYNPPRDVFVSLQEIVKVLPQFQYQIYFNTKEAQDEFEKDLQLLFKTILRGTKAQTNAYIPPKITEMSNGAPFLKGVKNIDIHPMISQVELDYYVQQYKISGFGGCLNWYRTHRINFEAEKGLPKVINHPALMVTAGRDFVLRPEMSKKMENVVPNLERAHVQMANHWILQDYPDEVNQILLDWLKKVTKRSKL